MTEQLQPSNSENFFNIEEIKGIYSFKPMVERWRTAIIADPNHWWDISRHQLVRDLPEGERQGALEEHPVVHINKQPWSEIPRSVQDVIKAAYDCASHDPDDQKQVSVTIGDRHIKFELNSPSLRGSIFREDLYGENNVTDVRLQLVDDEHPVHSWYTEPQRIPSGFWEFAKWPMAREAIEREISRRRHEEDIEPSIEERLMLNTPKTRIAMATIGELEDLAEFLVKATPQAIVWYVDHRFVPQIANPPWFDEPTHVLTSDEGQLQIKPIDGGDEEVVFSRKESTPEDKQRLQQLTGEALRLLITDESNIPLWERFRFTYEARRPFQWLAEFGYDGIKKPERGKQPKPVSNPQKGLAGALRGLLHNFGEETNEKLIESNESDDMFKRVDEEFLQELDQAVELIGQDATDERSSIGELVWRLGNRNVDIGSISLEELKQGLAKGILKYWEQTYAHGYSGDPW